MLRGDSNEEDFKKIREKHVETIRKQAREELFTKRRTVIQENPFKGDTSMSEQQPKKIKIIIVDQARRQLIEELIQASYSMAMFDELCQSINSSDVSVKHRGVIGLRKIVSTDKNPPIQRIVDAQLVPVLIKLMDQSECMQLQLEATWVLTNVASGESLQCQSIIDKGGLEVLIKILNQNKYGIVEQAIWAIGNIAGDCSKFRDMIIARGGLQPLVRIAQSSQQKNIVKQASWALSNLCRGSPLPKYELVKTSVPILCKSILSGVLDNQSLSDCCWAISYMSEGTKSKIQRVVQTGIIPKLIQNCYSPFLSIIVPTLRVIGNVSTGNQTQTQQILKQGGFELFFKLLDHTKKSVRRQVCWILSNIAAGTRSQVDQLIARKDIFLKINRLFQTDENDVKRQICYIYSNMVHLGSPQSVFQSVTQLNVLQHLSSLILQDEDVKTLQTALDCLPKILEVGNKVKTHKDDKNVLMVRLQSIPSLVDRFQQLQYHQSQDIYKRINKIIQKYFAVQNTMID